MFDASGYEPHMMEALPDRAKKGRGAVSSRSGRFERFAAVPVDDGWSQPTQEEPEREPLPTTLTVDSSRTVIARNHSPDVPFDRSINPYRGCEHGCVYCFARPTHAYLGLSPGLDFETKLFYKPNAPTLLDRELRQPSYAVAPIALGANTDPYQPVERTLGLTRAILEVLAAFRHPMGVITKSALVLRDIDVLAPMAANRLASVCISITTLDRDLARRLEPRAASPQRRLDTIRRLTEAGVPVAVLASPMIPGLNDHELDAILAAAADAGACNANYVLLRLPLEIAGLFTEWLAAHAPNRAKRVMSLIRQSRGGRLYENGFGARMKGSGPVAELLAARFRRATRRHGLAKPGWDLDTSRFSPPPRPGDQLSLL